MSKDMTLIVLGVLIVAMPVLGFPEWWRGAIVFIAGVGVFIIGCAMRVHAISEGTKHNTFTESRGGQEPMSGRE